MKLNFLFVTLIFILSCQNNFDKPYITTKSPLTLFSTQDGESEAIWPFTNVIPYDNILKSDDSFTVIHLGPDHPPIVKTVYGTIASTILGTPTMAISKNGRYAIASNHSWRGDGFFNKLTYPEGKPLFNSDIKNLSKQNLSPQLSDMIYMIKIIQLLIEYY